MLQLYFIAVVVLVGAGACFAVSDLWARIVPQKNHKVALTIVFFVALFAGILKFAKVVQPDVVVFGDFLPALGCITVAFCVFTEVYPLYTGAPLNVGAFVTKLFCSPEAPGCPEQSGLYRPYLGLVLIAIGVIHFFFPHVRFF